MKTKDFNNKLTSSKLLENMNKMFGMNVKLESYSREQLEDMRNKIRTRMFQQEGQAGYNDLLTKETYQKDKAMLALLNTRIKEMLGEDIGKLRDKLKTLEEAKKGVRAPKYTKKAKGSSGADDKDGDGKKDFDDIQVARMTAGGVPKKKAIAKATSDNFKEDTDKETHDYYFGKDKPKSDVGKSKELSKHTATTTGSGTKYTKRDLPGQDTADDADEKARKRKEKKMKEEKFDPLKHVKNPTPGEKKAAKDVKRSSYADRAAMLRSAEKDGRLKEADDKCNHTPKGKKCPVHGLKECGTYEAASKQIDELSPSTLTSYRHKARDSELRNRETARRNTDISQQTTNPRVAAKSADYAVQAQATADKRRAGQEKATSRLSQTGEGAMKDRDADRKDRAYQSHQARTTMKHIKNPTPGEKAAAQDMKPGSYKDRYDMLKSAEQDGRLKTEAQQIFKRHVRIVNESLAALLQEDEEGKAKAITAAGDIVNDYTSWMQRVGQYQTKSMIELADAIRADFGAAEAEAFKQAVAPALSATLETLMSQREAISNAVAVLAGEATPMEPMGAEPGIEPAGPDMMNEPGMQEPAGDEFGAADAAAGAGTPGREMRESRFQQKLAESHSIMAKLSR